MTAEGAEGAEGAEIMWSITTAENKEGARDAVEKTQALTWGS